MHVVGAMEPERDIGLIETELMLADLQALEGGREKLDKKVRAGEAGAVQEKVYVDALIERLSKGEWIGAQTGSTTEQAWLREYQLLTAKPIVFAVNIGEGQDGSPAVRRVEELARRRGARALTVFGALGAGVGGFAPGTPWGSLPEPGQW